MIVDLKSIGFEGEHHRFDQHSEELEGVLNDLVGKHPFDVDLEITPVGNSYQVQGRFHFSYDESCSRCGYEITVGAKNKINEFLVKEKERPRNTQSAGHSALDHDESLPSVTYLNTDDFDLGEFLHEMVAFAMSSYPKCEDQKLCDSRAFTIQDTPLEEAVEGHPGFAALKNLKLQ